MNKRPTLLKPVGPESLAIEGDFRLGDMVVRPSLLEVCADDVRETLEPRVMQVLVALAGANGMVVSRDELIRECWGGRIVGEDAINRCIARIRRLSNVAGSKVFEIETIPRVGYRLVAPPGNNKTPIRKPVAGAPQADAPPALADTDSSRFTSVFHNTRLLVGVASAIAAAALLIYGVLGFLRSAPVPTVVNNASIAVLPFENLSSEKGTGYFAAGIQDEILTRLAKIGSLKVISRTSTAHFSSRPINLKEIALQLGVAHVLEGSVQKAGNTVRVNVQLINAPTDDHIWAEDYDRKLEDIFAVESEVAQAIAMALAAKISPNEAKAIAAAPTTNLRAYDLYLRGLAYGRKASLGDSYRTAAAYLDEAVKADPKFTLAWARLARTEAYRYFGDEATPERREAARIAVAKAIGLQPDLPEAQVAQAWYDYFVERKFKNAEYIFARVHAKWPTNTDALEGLASILRRQGKWEQSFAATRKLIVLDPLVPQYRIVLADTLCMTRDFPEARRTIDATLHLWPDNGWARATKARIFQQLGQLDQAGLLLKDVYPAPDDQGITYTFWAQYLFTRQYQNGVSFFRGLAAIAQGQGQSNEGVALVYQMLGDFQYLSGDGAGARQSYLKSLDILQNEAKAQPDNPDLLMGFANTYAGLGDGNAALASAERLVQLRTRAGDAYEGTGAWDLRARMEARFGDRDRAVQEITRLMSLPGSFTPAVLRLDPSFDRVRGNPEFQKLLKGRRVE